MRHALLMTIGLIMVGFSLRTSPAVAGEVRIPLGPFSGGGAMTAEVKSITELRDEGIVRQQMDFSCGAASVAIILTYSLQMPCTEREVIDYIVAHSDARELILRNGFTLLDLKQFAESKGIKAVGYRLTFDLLRSIKQPVLLPIYIKEKNIRHYVVFLSAEDDKVFLADPATGRRTLSRDVFEQQWEPQIGMLFTRDRMPDPAASPLAIRPVDETVLPTSTVLSVALPWTFFYYHPATEF